MQANTAEAPQSGDGMQRASYPYDASLSYDHDDQPVAYGIQRGLHKIARRFGQLHALRVFRDSTDLTASPDLWVTVMALSPDGRRPATGGADGTVRVWDADTGRQSVTQ